MRFPGLILPHQIVVKLIQHAVSCLPGEACGLLAGKENQLLTAFPIRNIERNPKRFRMDPEEQVHAFLEIENSGQELLAIYHSHPDGSSRLSQIDLDNFYYPGVFSILLYPEANSWNLKAYDIKEKKIDEIYLIFTNIS